MAFDIKKRVSPEKSMGRERLLVAAFARRDEYP